MTLVESRNFYVSTDTITNGTSLDTTLYLPQGLLECRESEHMRLSVQSFSMRNNFYTVNQYNNRFYIVAADAGGAIIKTGLVTIPRGNYDSFDNATTGFAFKLKEAVNATLVIMEATLTANVSCSWDKLTGKLTLIYTVPPAWVSVKNLCFTINNYSASAGTLVQSIIGNNNVTAYSDSFQLLGGCKNINNEVTSFSEFIDIFDTSRNVEEITAVGWWQSSLASQENLYLRTNLNNSSFQTYGYDSGSTPYPQIVASNILARIPIGNSVSNYLDNGNATGTSPQYKSDIIYYTDNGNNVHSLFLQSKKETSMRLYLTDKYGRPIALESNQQLTCQGISFACLMRIDVFV